MRTVFIILIGVAVVSGCIHSESAESQSSLLEETPAENNNTPETSETESSDTKIIYLTESGFEPSDLTVNRGETVTWVNNDSRTMWIGSDQHPTHREYEGTGVREHCEDGEPVEGAFDQCSTGDRYKFTFEKTGEWGYHNHQPFIQGGTVTVE